MPKAIGYKRPKDTKKTIRRMLHYLGIHRTAMFFVALLVVISSFANIMGTYMLKPVINDYIVPGDIPGLIRAILFMGLMYGAGALATYGYNQLMVRTSQRVVGEIRQDLFVHTQNLPLKYFDAHTHGELMSRFTNDVDTISEALNSSFTMLIQSFIVVTGTIVMLIVLNFRLSLIVMFFLLAMFVFIQYNGKRSKKYFAAQQKYLGSINGFVEEMVVGQKVEKVFNHEDQDFTEFCRRNENLRQASTKALTYSGMMVPVIVALSYFNYAVSACVGGLFTLAGLMDIGSLASYLVYVRQSAMPMNQFTQQVNFLLSALSGAERIFEMMDEEPEPDQGSVTLCRVREKAGKLVECEEFTGSFAWKKPLAASACAERAVRRRGGADGIEDTDGTGDTDIMGDTDVTDSANVVSHEAGHYELIPLRGDVRFKNVVFGYTPDKIILNDITLYAKPGQKIAFVGSTGAGKTTIVNLINRFYEINGGRITYDGIDVRDIKKADLRRSMSMVIQDTHLFTGTIADNIRYGRLSATDEEVRQAAKLANAHSFIRRMPSGYDTVITGDGSALSQGQRQLLAIARAAVSKPPVLVLDEATSSIDTRTEKLIEKGMDALMEDRTVFVIAHRLSTVRNSKAIMVLEKGEIIERGDHEELLDQKGRYYELYTGQYELE